MVLLDLPGDALVRTTAVLMPYIAAKYSLQMARTRDQEMIEVFHCGPSR